MNYKVEAIVLKAKDIKEVDRIYTVFSKEKGKLTFVGKGTRRPTAKLASGVEPITLSEIFLIQAKKWLDKLTGVIILHQFPDIKSSEKKIFLVKNLFEVLDQLANEKEPNAELYEEVKYFLDLAEKKPAENSLELNLSKIQLSLIWKIIQWSGFQPEIFRCANCNAKLAEQEFYWFNATTGLECPSCASRSTGKKIRIEKDTVKVLRVFLSQKTGIVAKLVVSPKVLSQILQCTRLVLQEVLQRKIFL